MSYEKNENEQKEAGFGPFLKYKLKVFSPLVGVLTLDLLSRRFFEKMAIRPLCRLLKQTLQCLSPLNH